MTEIVYSIRDSRIKKSQLNGFDAVGKGVLSLSQGSDYHMIIVDAIDGEDINSTWGRLRFDVEIPKESVYYAYVLGTNEYTSPKDIKTISGFKNIGAKSFVNQSDILLYDVIGRFLYVAIEIEGEGEGSISNIAIDRVGDNFMGAFPEIYHEENGFFHRYISIFSSIYNDFGDDIAMLSRVLDLDHAPAKLLITFGHWLGIDIDCDIKDENVMRLLVKEAYELNKIKGTKAAINRIAEIMLGEEVTILEKNIMEQYEDESELEQFKMLFGDNVYNICILMDKQVGETQKSQFMYILRQFVPVRARIQLVSLRKEGELDFHSYLDMNAKLFESRGGLLDNEMAMDHAVTLRE